MFSNHPDFESPQSVVRALYEVISGDASSPKQWSRYMALCHPKFQAHILTKYPDGRVTTDHLSAEEYRDSRAPILDFRSFFEVETDAQTQQFGNFAHVWSAYEGRLGKVDNPASFSGVNSVQLIFQNGRWWALSIVWEREAAQSELFKE